MPKYVIEYKNPNLTPLTPDYRLFLQNDSSSFVADINNAKVYDSALPAISDAQLFPYAYVVQIDKVLFDHHKVITVLNTEDVSGTVRYYVSNSLLNLKRKVLNGDLKDTYLVEHIITLPKKEAVFVIEKVGGPYKFLYPANY